MMPYVRQPGTTSGKSELRICVVKTGDISGVSETFISSHIAHLPGHVSTLSGVPPILLRHKAASDPRKASAARLIMSKALRHAAFPVLERMYARRLRALSPDVVLAEYGPTGAALSRTCETLGIPLVVHFHGYDAYRSDVLRRHRAWYAHMFRMAAAVVAVSRPMGHQLETLGCSPEKIHLIPSGVNTTTLPAADVRPYRGRFMAVGRFVEKKRPDLTLRAFAFCRRKHPEACLDMVGEGPLLPACKQLAVSLGLSDAVRFHGALPHESVLDLLSHSYCFVQHSAHASSGDTEGMPVAILEASGMGLPVISTRHAGIPDAVLHGTTGLLGAEGDVGAMAQAMELLLREPETAARMGKAGRAHVLENFFHHKTRFATLKS